MLPHDIMFTARGGPRTPPPSGIASSPSNVCPSCGWTDGHVGRWKEQEWPQCCACPERGGFSFVALQIDSSGLSFPSGQWRANPVLAVRVHCCSSTRSGPRAVVRRERQIFSPWDVDVPSPPRTELGLFCCCMKLRLLGKSNNVQSHRGSLRSARATLSPVHPSTLA